jgi:cupin 2 domain-containing protein
MVSNLYDPLPPAGSEEHFSEILSRPGVKIERIVSTGQASGPGFWYDQAHTEWVLLLQGAAGIEFEGEAAPRILRPGDHIEIAPHQRHRIAWTQAAPPTVWLAVHLAERP